ncbi:DNA-methyltransferase [Xanthomonas campestris]|uniref:DNA-methyltransferase n=1 Tax=Xanthomonas campestris TaxID=339 RepID=UPI001E2F656B|nr:site-specific DNA-methyltransferase [Xanthomonas campestris]MCC4604741.1 site-specific DNA-methyltransferase [Xanthomonas campestris pv. parthenii]
MKTDLEEKIVSALGVPDIYSPGVLIYHRDCIEGLRALPADIVDLTVTSPPYNIGKEYETVREVDEYLDWCAEWLVEIYRVTSDKGALWLNLGYLSVPDRAKAIPIPYLLWNRVPFFLQQEVVWRYGAGVSAKRSFSPRNEKFLWYLKNKKDYTFNLDEVRDPNVLYPNQKKNGKLRCNPLGKNPGDVWDIPKVTSGKNRSSKERTAHPAQFPEALVHKIIKASSNPGDLVVDPFLGSGTTAAIGKSLGRVVLGFELNKSYIPIISDRLKQYEFRSFDKLPTTRERLQQSDQLPSFDFR